MTKERKERIVNELTAARKRLIHAGLWEKTLTHWVQEEISSDVDFSENDKELENIDVIAGKWTEEKLKEKYYRNHEELKTQLKILPALRIWCRRQWYSRIDSLYLEHKDYFDKAKCRMIRVKSKEWAYEIYLRIKEGEVDFGEAAKNYGEGPEK